MLVATKYQGEQPYRHPDKSQGHRKVGAESIHRKEPLKEGRNQRTRRVPDRVKTEPEWEDKIEKDERSPGEARREPSPMKSVGVPRPLLVRPAL